MKKLILVLYTLVFLLSATPTLAANNRVSMTIPKPSVTADPAELSDNRRKVFAEFFINGKSPPVTIANSNSSNPIHFNLGSGPCEITEPDGKKGTFPDCLVSGLILLKDVDLKDGDTISYGLYITDEKGQNAQSIASGTQIYNSASNDGTVVFDQTGVDKSDRVLTPAQLQAAADHKAAVDAYIHTGQGAVTNPDVAAKAATAAKSTAALLPGGVKIPLPKVAAVNNIYCDAGKKEIATAIGCIEATPQGLATKVLGFAIGIAGGITFLLMALGSIKLITAGGNPDSVQEGRTILTSAIAGLLVVVLSVFILRFFGVVVLKIPGLG